MVCGQPLFGHYGIPQAETPDQMVLPLSQSVFASGFAAVFGASTQGCLFVLSGPNESILVVGS